MNRIKKVVGGTAAALLLGAGGALLSTPAHAADPAVVPPGGFSAGTVTPDGDGFIVTKRAVDEGGVVYKISVDWNYKYVYQGVTRVSVNPLVVYRTDEAVTSVGSPEDAGLDLHFDVYNSSGTQIQHRLYDAVDLDYGADNKASFNPANPRSNADVADVDDSYSYIRVKVGTDADGKGSSPWVIFPQPEGIQLKPAG
jgi:hypothetical protein